MIVNGTPVLRGWVSVPDSGAIVGRLELPAVVEAGAASINDGALVCAVKTSQVFANRCHVVIHGGAGGLDGELPAKSYRNITAGAILDDILSQSGETASPSQDPAIRATFLSFWTSRADTAGAQIALLAEALDVQWRTLMDGTIWLGTGAPVGTVFTEPAILNFAPNTGELVYAGEFAVPVGASVAAGTVARAVTDVDRNARTTVWIE